MPTIPVRSIMTLPPRGVKRCMTGNDVIGLPTVVLFGFVRICTNPRIFQTPFTVEESTGRVES